MGQIPALDGAQRGAVADAYRRGATIRSIAATYGVGYSTVYRALQREGVVMRPRGGPWPTADGHPS